MKKRVLSIILSAALCIGSTVIALADPDYTSQSTIQQVQEALNANGFDCGTPDGIAGSGTNGAIQNYRAEKGLPEGGIDQELIGALEDTGYSFFFPITAEELGTISSTIDECNSQVSQVLNKIGALNSEVTSAEYGNYSMMGAMVIMDVKYEPSDDRAVLLNCMYIPGESPAWTVNYAWDKNTGDYYYLSPDYEGAEDLFPFPGAESKSTEGIAGSTSGSKESEPAASSSSVQVDFHSSVKNDVTGKWRLAIVDTSAPVSSYIVDYYKEYFKSDDEIHAIINRHDNTTTRVAVYGDMIDVTTLQYIKGEENDANLLFCGDMIADEFYDKTTGEVLEF